MFDEFVFTIGDYAFEWNRAHTVNVWSIDSTYRDEWDAMDPFSLGYDRNDWSEGEAMLAALEWIKYMEGNDV